MPNLASASLHEAIQLVERLQLFFVALKRLLLDLVDTVSVAHVLLPRNTGPHFTNQLLVSGKLFSFLCLALLKCVFPLSFGQRTAIVDLCSIKLPRKRESR